MDQTLRINARAASRGWKLCSPLPRPSCCWFPCPELKLLPCCKCLRWTQSLFACIEEPGDCVAAFMWLPAKELKGKKRLIVQYQGKRSSVWCHIPPGTAVGKGEAMQKLSKGSPGVFHRVINCCGMDIWAWKEPAHITKLNWSFWPLASHCITSRNILTNYFSLLLFQERNPKLKNPWFILPKISSHSKRQFFKFTFDLSNSVAMNPYIVYYMQYGMKGC